MHCGLDIGSFSIKVIQCQKSGQKYFLQQWGEAATPTALDSLDKQAKTTLAATIKRLMAEAKISTNSVGVALPESKVYSRVIQLPVLSDAELASAMEYEAEQYIPLPLEQLQLEYFVLSRPPQGAPGSKMEVLLIAAQKQAIDETLSVLEIAGLTPLFLETEILAVSRALSVYPDTSLLLNIGKHATDLAILQADDLRFVYNFSVGGETLTRALVQTLSLDPTQAEAYKKAYGLDQTLLEGKVSQAISPIFNQIIQQMQKILTFYLQNNPKSQPVKRIILSGGTAELPGVVPYLTRAVGLETVLGNPFANFESAKSFPQDLLKFAARFATATGLAIREV